MTRRRKSRQKSQHPSLLAQIEAIEQTMADEPAGPRWFDLLRDRERLLAAAQREAGHDTATDVEHDEPAPIDSLVDEDQGGSRPVPAGFHTGQSTADGHLGSATPTSDQERSNHGQILLQDGSIRADLGAVQEVSS